MDELAFQSSVIRMARIYGWRVAQFRPARLKDGQWRTPVGGDGKGYPDLTFVRERVLWAECKSKKGRLTEDQKAWIEALKRAGQEVYIWRPDDLDHIHDVLHHQDPERWKRLLDASDGDTRQAANVVRTLDRVRR